MTEAGSDPASAFEGVAVANRQCIVCGNVYLAPPSSNIVTCSRACSKKRKRETHVRKSNQWSRAARANLATKGQTPNLKRGTPAARKSPLAGPFETNQEAKIWIVRDPGGEIYEVRNLRKWCRDNAHLFEPDPWANAYAGLRQVQAWLIGKRQRQVSRWKDWTLDAPNREPEG